MDSILLQAQNQFFISDTLLKEFEKNINRYKPIWVMEPSKYGKTSLINFLKQRYPTELVISINLSSIRTIDQFHNQLTELFIDYGLINDSTTNSLYDLFLFVNKNFNQGNKKLIIIFDDFQYILHWKNYINGAKQIRSAIKNVKNVIPIYLSQSNHVIEELFTTPYMPFNGLAHRIHLTENNNINWNSILKEYSNSISFDVDNSIIELITKELNNHPYLIFRAIDHLKNLGIQTNQKESFDQLLKEWETISSWQFKNWTQELSEVQYKVLHAIIDEVEELMGKNTLKRYGINGSASVIRALKGMEKKGIIHRYSNGKAKLQHPLYKSWLVKTIFN